LPGRGWWSGSWCLAQAAIWLLLPLIVYGSPPRRSLNRAGVRPRIPGRHRHGAAAVVLARRHRLSRRRQPHFGVYLLAQACAVATFIAFYQLARAIVGGPHAVLAVLLSMTVVVFSRRASSSGAGAGAAALGAVAAALLAVDRAEPAQRLVRLVDRLRGCCC